MTFQQSIHCWLLLPLRGVIAAERFAQYRLGQGVDCIAGAEALISHIISKELTIPCAHAPAFLPTACDKQVSPKACAEELGYSFLPCILAYLHHAPNLIPMDKIHDEDSSQLLTCKEVKAVVAPFNALGGPAVLSFLARGTLVIAVTDNQTTMKVAKDDLPVAYRDQVVIARSYAEAAGLLTAHKRGILFDSLGVEIPRLNIQHL